MGFIFNRAGDALAASTLPRDPLAPPIDPNHDLIRAVTEATRRISFNLGYHPRAFRYLINWDDWHVPPYHVPFRALIPRGAKNLLVAGRCFSAEQLALSSARLMTTASMMGQAAGIAAAWASGAKRAVGETSTQSLVRELKNRGAVLEPSPDMTPLGVTGQAQTGAGAAVDAPTAKHTVEVTR